MQTNPSSMRCCLRSALSQADGLIGRTVTFTATAATFDRQGRSVVHHQRRAPSRRSRTATKVALGPGVTIS